MLISNVIGTGPGTAQHSRSTMASPATTGTAAEEAAADTARRRPCPTTPPAPQTAQGKARTQAQTVPPTQSGEIPGTNEMTSRAS